MAIIDLVRSRVFDIKDDGTTISTSQSPLFVPLNHLQFEPLRPWLLIYLTLILPLFFDYLALISGLWPII